VQYQLAGEASDWITGRYDLHDDARDGVVKDEDDVADELEAPAEVGSDPEEDYEARQLRFRLEDIQYRVERLGGLLLHPNVRPLTRYDGDLLTSEPILETYNRAEPNQPPSQTRLDPEGKGFRVNQPEGPSCEFSFRWQPKRREAAPTEAEPMGEG
jgi:hypothetical protein